MSSNTVKNANTTDFSFMLLLRSSYSSTKMSIDCIVLHIYKADTVNVSSVCQDQA